MKSLVLPLTPSSTFAQWARLNLTCRRASGRCSSRRLQAPRALKNTRTAKASSEGTPDRIHRLFLDAEQETPLGSAWLTSLPSGFSESDGIPVVKPKIPLT